MDLMSPPRPADLAMRIHRRHDIVTADGMDGVFRVAAALRESGYRVRDFSADVREGVVLSSLTCTVSLTSDESELFIDQLQQVQSVVSVEQW
ncbi:MAG: hypothetical protein GEU83_00530 [Pseudonocardiaceae bacterium]|nr:hypothetical protein [Pseudonocardiaceae bacterium]